MQGYGFTDKGFGNFKLPVLFLGMLLPLILSGPGRLSLDHYLRRRTENSAATSESVTNQQETKTDLEFQSR
jgi:putative oxidoreductase